MKTLNGKNYYSKEDLIAIIGCSMVTLNRRIAAAGVKGYNMGHKKYYTPEQMQILAEYRA